MARSFPLVVLFDVCIESRLHLTMFHVNSGPKEDNGRDEDGSVNPGSNLFVTGIHPRLTEAEVTRLFEKYGEVEKCQIMKDPHTKESRGFGFVKMVTSDQADAAKEGLQDEEIEGRSLSIEKARRARPRTPTPGKYFGPPKRGQCLFLRPPPTVFTNPQLQRTDARVLRTVVVVEATVVDMVAVVITVVATAVAMILIATVEAEVTIALVMKTVVIAAIARTEGMTVAIVTIEAAMVVVVPLLVVPVERIAMTVDTSAVIAMTTATAVLIVTLGLARIVSAMLPAGERRDVPLVMTENATTALIAMLNEPVSLLPLDMPKPAPEPRPVNLTPVPPNFLATKSLRSSLRPGHCY